MGKRWRELSLGLLSVSVVSLAVVAEHPLLRAVCWGLAGLSFVGFLDVLGAAWDRRVDPQQPPSRQPPRAEQEIDPPQPRLVERRRPHAQRMADDGAPTATWIFKDGLRWSTRPTYSYWLNEDGFSRAVEGLVLEIQTVEPLQPVRLLVSFSEPIDSCEVLRMELEGLERWKTAGARYSKIRGQRLEVSFSEHPFNPGRSLTLLLDAKRGVRVEDVSINEEAVTTNAARAS